MKFVIATGNEGKVREFKRILEPMGFEVLSLKEMGLTLDVEETGTTFAENARIKAQEACRLTGLAAVADDFGPLCGRAEIGAPGIYSARYSGEGDDGNNQKLLRQLAGVPGRKTHRALYLRHQLYFPGSDGTDCRGDLRGENRICSVRRSRFRLRPAVVYVGERSFGQYGDEEKDKISHRGKALRLLCEKLKEYQAKND